MILQSLTAGGCSPDSFETWILSARPRIDHAESAKVGSVGHRALFSVFTLAIFDTRHRQDGTTHMHQIYP